MGHAEDGVRKTSQYQQHENAIISDVPHSLLKALESTSAVSPFDRGHVDPEESKTEHQVQTRHQIKRCCRPLMSHPHMVNQDTCNQRCKYTCSWVDGRIEAYSTHHVFSIDEIREYRLSRRLLERLKRPRKEHDA